MTNAELGFARTKETPWHSLIIKSIANIIHPSVYEVDFPKQGTSTIYPVSKEEFTS